MTSTRRWRLTLAFAVTISITGNVAYALMTANPTHAVGAGIAAAVAPTMLFLITHNLAAEGQGAVAGWRKWFSLAGAWAITGGAFAASYIELHSLMVLLGRSPASAILTPLIVDVAIAVASVRVLDTPTSTASAADAVPAPTSADAPLHLVAAPDADPHLDRAHALVAAGRTTADVAAVHRVLRDADAGASQRRCADAAGVTPAMVQRILQADREQVAAG